MVYWFVLAYKDGIISKMFSKLGRAAINVKIKGLIDTSIQREAYGIRYDVL